MKKLLILLLLSFTFISLNAQVEIFRGNDSNTDEVEEEETPEIEEDDDETEEESRNVIVKEYDWEEEDEERELVEEKKRRKFDFVLLPDLALNFGDSRDNFGDDYSFFNFGIQPKFGIHYRGLSIALGPTYQHINFNYYNPNIEDQRVNGWGGSIVAQYEISQLDLGVYPMVHAEFSTIRYKLSNFEIPFGFTSAPVGGGTKYMFSDRAFGYGLLLYDLTLLDSEFPLLGLQYRASFGFYF